jgi:predicted nucleotidyltransferase
MYKTAQEILNIIKLHQDAIKGFGVRRPGLFGLRVRVESKDSSDLDFVVDFEKKTFDNYMGLKFFWKNFSNVRLILS